MISASKTITGWGQDPIKALAALRLTGKDEAPKDGINEAWACSTDFDCADFENNLKGTLTADTNTIYKGFVPISPLRSDVESLQFIIAPLEDPLKAYAETTPDVHQQPHVTVLLKVKPAATETQNFGGEIPSISLQTTVTTRAYGDVKSFWGRNDGVCPK